MNYASRAAENPGLPVSHRAARRRGKVKPCAWRKAVRRCRPLCLRRRVRHFAWRVSVSICARCFRQRVPFFGAPRMRRRPCSLSRPRVGLSSYCSGPGGPGSRPRPQGPGESPPAKCRGDGAPRGAPPGPRFARRGRVRRRRARPAALHRGDFCPRVRVSWDEAIGPVPVQRSSSRRGLSAPRSGPGASRERGYEPRPQAPHPPRFRDVS